MFFRNLFRKLFGYYKLTARQFIDPGTDIPEIYGYSIYLNKEEIACPGLNGASMIFSGKPIQPYDIEFGYSPARVREVLGLPILTIDNSRQIHGHQVMVFKRRISEYKSCCQAHFINHKLFLVTDEIKKPFRPGIFITRAIINILGYATDGLEDPDYGNTIITDSANNLMIIGEEISVKIRVQRQGADWSGR